jgi:hypothetical protein
MQNADRQKCILVSANPKLVDLKQMTKESANCALRGFFAYEAKEISCCGGENQKPNGFCGAISQELVKANFGRLHGNLLAWLKFALLPVG